MESIEIQAQKRDALGKGAVRKMRVRGSLPAVLYGGGADPMPLMLDTKSVERILKSHSGEHSILNLSFEGEAAQLAIIKDVQAETVTSKLLHIDLQRIRMDEAIEVTVEFELVNTENIKKLGGIIQQIMNEINIECLPDKIPDKIIVDMSSCGVGDSIAVSGLSLGEGITILDDADEVIVTVLAPKAMDEKAEGEAAAEGEEKAEKAADDKGKKPEKSEKEGK